MKKIAILGATGSIGTQALDVVREHPDRYEAYLLTAHSQIELLAEQARIFRPEILVTTDERRYEALCRLVEDLPVKVFAGVEALCEALRFRDIDIVLTAMVGFAGLRPTIAAIESGKTIALANKETLVVAGALITELAAKHRARIIPVDSEHSAIFQSLVGEPMEAIDRLLLTASGGPFRSKTLLEMPQLTAAQALRHPNWEMGAKITIDSATMMNKGLELIEARWLFGLPASQIDIIVHPESIVHSAVQFRDGSVKAQLGLPDMRLPIHYALAYPERPALSGERLDLCQLSALHFERPDFDRFDCLRIAYEVLELGGNAPCVMNAANEVANALFREGRCGFLDIARCIREVLRLLPHEAQPTLSALFEADAEARRVATRLLVG